MIIKELKPLSLFSTNSYLVISDEGNAALIDAPDDAKYILKFASEQGCKITKLLLTHGHCDHISAASEIQSATNCEIYIHELDEKKLNDPVGNLTAYFGLEGITPPRSVKTVSDGDIITLDEIEFKVFHTPGHTSGSVCYICGDVMFSGDTLFNLSIGRTDMPDGSYATLSKSLEKLKNLPENYTVYPGHMEKTQLDFEKRNNPYFM